MRSSLAARALTRSAWTVAGGCPERGPRTEDYESVIVPLTELLFTVRRCRAAPRYNRRSTRACERSAGWCRCPTCCPGGGARPTSPACARASAAPQRVGLEAFAKVVRNLGWDREAKDAVFGHTHQPLAGVGAMQGTGALLEHGLVALRPAQGLAPGARVLRASRLAGTAVRIDTERDVPQHIRMLARRNGQP